MDWAVRSQTQVPQSDRRERGYDPRQHSAMGVKGVPARAGPASRGQYRADYGTTALEALVMHMNIIAEIMMTGEHNSTIENARQRFKGR